MMVKIRKAQENDFSILSEIYTRAYNSINIGEKWTVESAEKLLRHLYDEQKDLFFVILSGETIVGAIVGLIKPWWDGNHITDGEIFVDPNYQSKGFGRMLIKHLFIQAKEKYGAVSWDTFTHVVHKYPLKWYESMGFKVIEKWTMITGDVDTVLNNLEK